MAEGGGQEGYFWDSYPWVMSNKSSVGSGLSDKNLIDPSVGNIHCEMKQPKMGDIGDSSGADKEVVATIVDSGNKRAFDDFEIKKEDDVKVSSPNDKGKRELEPNDHDLHIWTERERRKKMRNMFHQLHALIPELPPKTDKTSVVEEAVRYIKTLQKTVQKLETKKLEKLYGALTNTTIASPISPQTPAFNTRESFLADQCSSTSHFGMISPANSSSYSFPVCSPTVFQTWASSNVTVNVCGVDAHISICSSPKSGLATAICFVLEKYKLEVLSAQIFSDQSKIMFMIHAHANTRDQFAETFLYDEIYKQAATEIMHWVNAKSP